MTLKSEEEIREHLKILKKVKTVIHPSVIRHLEWVVCEGSDADMKFLMDTLKETGDRLEKKN